WQWTSDPAGFIAGLKNAAEQHSVIQGSPEIQNFLNQVYPEMVLGPVPYDAVSNVGGEQLKLYLQFLSFQDLNASAFLDVVPLMSLFAGDAEAQAAFQTLHGVTYDSAEGLKRIFRIVGDNSTALAPEEAYFDFTTGWQWTSDPAGFIAGLKNAAEQHSVIQGSPEIQNFLNQVYPEMVLGPVP
ncbi:MAG: hypothetical protein GY841_16660, partial [FCB group bacterium]|nr:hypothetical protein [FCB group bacterium]